MKERRNLRNVVRVLHGTLPAPFFDGIYNITFPLYKEAIRLRYGLKGQLRYRHLDRNRWQTVRKVYSIMPYTLVGIGGLEVTYTVARGLNQGNVDGDFVEMGVARGGCAALMGRAIFDDDEPQHPVRKLWLFDSYEGLPNPTAEDFDPARGDGTGDHVHFLTAGSCLGRLDEVQRLMFEVMKFPREKINFVKGWFQETVPIYRDKIRKIALLRIDGDWYESTKCCLEGLYDKVVPGGAIIVDDYASCYGCQKAVDEFLSHKQLDVKIELDGRGGCYFFKPSV